jgi:signal transduction histidine kinase
MKAAAAPLAALTGGIAATIVVCLALGTDQWEVWEIVRTAVPPAIAVGVVGAGALWLLRGRSIGVQAAAVALVPVLAVAVGAWAAARAMFISSHDRHGLAVVLVAAGTIGVVFALLLGRRVGEGSRALGDVARRIGAGDGPGDIAVPATGELAYLAREIELMAAELDATRKSEQALDASRRELVAWVSHDLRTPLAGIRAIAEALEDGVAEDRATIDRYHRIVRVEADRLAALVDDLFPDPVGCTEARARARIVGRPRLRRAGRC